MVVSHAYGEDLQEQFRDIQKKIEDQKKKIEQAKVQETSFVTQIQEVNKKLYSVKKRLRHLKIKISRTKERIIIVKKDIDEFKKMLDRQKSYFKRKLRSMQRIGIEDAGVLSVLASSENFSQMVRNMHYLKKIAEYDHGQIEQYKQNLEELDRKKKKLNSLYSKLRTDENELQREQEGLNTEIEQKELLLASVVKQKNGYRKMLRELTESSNKIRKMLEDRKSNTYKLTRFALLKGKLPWPVSEGEIAIQYGSYKDPRYKTPVFRRGVYIKADEGMTAKAIYPGKVVYADWFKGYGKVIIVNHGSGYHSVYANLNEIFCKPGDVVKRHQAVGKVGDSGTLNAPALYFEIRYKGKPLNPRQWLAKK